MVEVQVDEEAAGKLAYLLNGADQPVDAVEVLRYRIRRGPAWDVYAGPTLLASVETPDDALFVVYRHCYAAALAPFHREGWVQLHAALASVEGRRFLAVGPKGAGKTTLMARLLYDGHAVEGDETVLTRDGDVLALPRALHVKEGTDAVVPELGAVLGALPWTATADGRRIRAFDPSRHGFRWHLGRGPADALVFLDGGRGERASVSPLSRLDAVRRLVEHSVGAGGPCQARITACARLVHHRPAFELATGPPASSARALTDALVSIPAPAVVSNAGVRPGEGP